MYREPGGKPFHTSMTKPTISRDGYLNSVD